MKVTDPHVGPGGQTSVWVVSTLVPGLGLACEVLLYGPELTMVFVFLKGLTTTTTKTQQRTICGLSVRWRPPGSRQEVSADGDALVCTVQLQGQRHVHLSPRQHLNFGSSDGIFQILFPYNFFPSISSKFILTSFYLALESFQFSVN